MDIDAINKWVLKIKEVEENIEACERDIASGLPAFTSYQGLMSDDIEKRILHYLRSLDDNDLPGSQALVKSLEQEQEQCKTTINRLLTLLTETKDFSYFFRQLGSALDALESSDAYFAAAKAVEPHISSKRPPKQPRQPAAAATPYKVLGLTPDATDAMIRQAYKRLAQTWHPDKHTNKPQVQQDEANKNFRAINEAHTTLMKHKK